MSTPDTRDKAIIEEIANVRNPENSKNWVLIGYEKRSNTVLKVLETGEEDIDEMMDYISDGKVHYGYICLTSFKQRKFVYIAWLGEGVTGLQKGTFPNHAMHMATFIKRNGHSIHLQVNARSEEDLDEEDITNRLKKAFGSNFDAGQVNQGIQEGVTVTEGRKYHKEAQNRRFTTVAQQQREQEEQKAKELRERIEKAAAVEESNADQYKSEQEKKKRHEEGEDEDDEEDGEEEILAKAVYYYIPEQEGDLGFKEGDIITVLDKTDADGWWEGEKDGQKGWFPSTFVELITK